MECPNCKAETHRLTYYTEGGFCEKCCKPPEAHIGCTVVKGVNKYKPKMTYNEMQHITTRKLGADGIVRSHPRWETKDY